VLRPRPARPLPVSLPSPAAAAAFGLLAFAALTLCLAVRRRYSVVVVRGPSMEPTLQPGDRVLARRIDGRSVGVGDIVILRVPADIPDRRTGELESTVVKRVAAVAGDPFPPALRHVGAPADRARARARCAGTGPRPDARTDTEPAAAAPAAAAVTGSDTQVLPPGHLAVLGDNPRASVDSRVWGPIRTDSILAKVLRPL
jgi:signal peptidase I